MKSSMLSKTLLVTFCLTFFLAGAAFAGPALRLASTTSTANTGLLDVLADKFKADTGVELQYVAVGTGKALKLGANCDVDALMVHAPAAEKKYVAAGHGIDRRLIMYNDFVIIGPAADPAGIKGMTPQKALSAIRAKEATFCSRGDNSGTNKKEKTLWKAAGGPAPDKEAWYVQTGQGMIKTINIAAEKNGYTMTDRGTYIKYSSQHKGNPPLKILVEGAKILFNQYSVMTVNPKQCPKVQTALAKKFADWITSAPIQKFIADFRLLGQPLFTPNAAK